MLMRDNTGQRYLLIWLALVRLPSVIKMANKLVEVKHGIKASQIYRLVQLWSDKGPEEEICPQYYK